MYGDVFFTWNYLIINYNYKKIKNKHKNKSTEIIKQLAPMKYYPIFSNLSFLLQKKYSSFDFWNLIVSFVYIDILKHIFRNLKNKF